jgi:hypothetical protein
LSKIHLAALTLTLTVLGLSLFLYKWLLLEVPLQPAQTTDAWTVEARVTFAARRGRPVKVKLLLPYQPDGFTILDETFVSRGYGVTSRIEENNRESVWAVRRASGEQLLYYQAVVYQDETSSSPATRDKAPPFPKPPELGEPYDSAIRTLVEEVRAQSADIATFAAQVLKLLSNGPPTGNVALLLTGEPSAENKARVAVNILAGARIPARIIYGLSLSQTGRNIPLVPRLEVHNGERWLSFDPTTGQQGTPNRYLTWTHGPTPLLEVDGGTNASIEFSVAENVFKAMELAQQRAKLGESRALEFSLLSLPVRTQAVYRVILTIPLGALVLVLLRNIVGIKTFGTFSPVLIALAFRETRLVNGILLFSLVVILGLSVRFYLEQLKLLMVPRLAAVLIIVVLLMSALSVLTYKLGLELGFSVTLFPMVILTMTIERMSVVWEERGPTEAIQQAMGSMFGAVLSYGLMNNKEIEHLLFVFPELLLVLLAVTLLLGRYTGYRLLELRRFRSMVRS